MKAFDSKGININIGDRVWNIEGYGPSGIVEAITEYNGKVSGVKCRTDQGYLHIADPSFLTHDEVPPRDTWESYEEKLCYLLDDGDMAYKLTERAKNLAGVNK